MKYFENVLPPGDMENDNHIPDTKCPCGPELRFHEGKTFLFHRSSDNREVWMGAEMMLGYTCLEHVMPVDRSYMPGYAHNHIELPEPYYEYEHEKIDPR